MGCDPVSIRYVLGRQTSRQAYLLIGAILRSCRELPCGQIMFFTGGHRIRLAGFEQGVPRVGVGLG